MYVIVQPFQINSVGWNVDHYLLKAGLGRIPFVVDCKTNWDGHAQKASPMHIGVPWESRFREYAQQIVHHNFPPLSEYSVEKQQYRADICQEKSDAPYKIFWA